MPVTDYGSKGDISIARKGKCSESCLFLGPITLKTGRDPTQVAKVLPFYRYLGQRNGREDPSSIHTIPTQPEVVE